MPATKKRHDAQYGLYDGHVLLLVREGAYLNGQSDRARVCPLSDNSGQKWNVRFWHKADIPSGTAYVRFGGKADIEIYAVVAWFVVLVVL